MRSAAISTLTGIISLAPLPALCQIHDVCISFGIAEQLEQALDKIQRLENKSTTLVKDVANFQSENDELKEVQE